MEGVFGADLAGELVAPAKQLASQALAVGQLQGGLRDADGHGGYHAAVVTANRRGETGQVLRGLFARLGPSPASSPCELALEVFYGRRRPRRQPAHLLQAVPLRR